jgi:flagellar basal-body rod protein FlgB
MTPIYLFNVVSQHNRWLSVRQSTVAGNIANANTPGFKARDVVPFEATLDSARLAMAATSPAHLSPADASSPAVESASAEAWDVTHTGNTVSLEQELLKANDVNRAYRLNASVAKAFHRMLLASSKV